MTNDSLAGRRTDWHLHGDTPAKTQVDIAENRLRYWRYCQEFVASRKLERADDLTSELLDAHDANPDELTYAEVESIIYGLSFAGHEIVSNYLSNMLLALLPRRHDWQAICEDPALIPNALEEVLRFDSPQTSWRRVTNHDTEFVGVKIPAGTQIFLSLGAANHEATNSHRQRTLIFDARTLESTSPLATAFTFAWARGSHVSRRKSLWKRSHSVFLAFNWWTAKR